VDKEQRKLWRKLVAAWRADHAVARHLYLARLYTQKYPKDMSGWVALGDGLSGVASYDEALLAFRRARKLSPERNLNLVYSGIGHLYREKGEYRRAESWYRRAIEAKETVNNVVFLGACLAKQGRYREAKRYYRRAIRIGAEEADEAYFNLGLILRAEGKYEAALECFERAIEIDPKYALAKQARKDIVELFKLKKASNNGMQRTRK
jgi:tetratricopeptide (TPR) repeat protein